MLTEPFLKCENINVLEDLCAAVNNLQCMYMHLQLCFALSYFLIVVLRKVVT